MTNAPGISRILTLVFTDLADSTALKTQRGDQAISELIARHRTLVHRLATESDGRIVSWAGDGCFLTFEMPSDPAGILYKVRTLDRVETIAGHPTPTELTMTVVPAHTSSRIILTDVEYDTGLAPELFEAP